MDISLKSVEAFEDGYQEGRRDAIRHGKWKMRTDEDGFWYYCSECKQNALFDIFNYQEKSDYCPQCGAKMEGCNDA